MLIQLQTHSSEIETTSNVNDWTHPNASFDLISCETFSKHYDDDQCVTNNVLNDQAVMVMRIIFN